MNRKFAVTLFVLFMLVMTSGSGVAQTSGPQSALGTVFTYQGQLKKGSTPVTGNCSMAFRLYDAAGGGNPIGNAITPTVTISNSLFTVSLDFGTSAFAGEARWLGIQVKCPGDTTYADLGRQPISAAPYSLYSTSTGALQGRSIAATTPVAGQVLKFDGITWLPADDAIGPPGSGDISAVYAGNGLSGGGTTGDVTLSVAFAGSGSANTVARSDHNHSGVYSLVGHTHPGSDITSAVANATNAVNADMVDGLHASAFAPSSHNHWGASWSGSGTGLTLSGDVGLSISGTMEGIYASAGSVGVWGVGTASGGESIGVLGQASSPDGYGGSFSNGGGVALQAYGTGVGNSLAALRADNGNSQGIAAYFTTNSDHPTLEMDQRGSGRLLDLQTWGSGDFIAGYDGSVNQKFRIDANGTGHSSGGWTTSAQDYAEMLPAVEGLEPGDVLVIGDDGQLARSTAAYQTSVVGVYSTQPGFVGGVPVEGSITGTIPLAIIGIVPVKVSAENGVIHPGDLLVASSIPGHAMKAGSNPPFGTVIGKALAKFDSGTGVIKMLVTLR